MTRTQLRPADDPDALAAALACLQAGDLVAIPTETVYGLAADALDRDAVRLIFRVKGRPSHNPLICHVSDSIMAARYVETTPMALTLMKAFWPGPLTLVLPLKNGHSIAPEVTAGLTTLAIRCPAQPKIRHLIAALGHPVAAPSANPSGKLSPTRADDVKHTMDGQIPLILDGGPTIKGIESTIIGFSGKTIQILRPGTITAEDLQSVTGAVIEETAAGPTLTAPGQMASHYAPRATLRLNATSADRDETLIGFGAVACDFNLSPAGDLDEAASRLFGVLRAADEAGRNRIAVTPVPNEGVGRAINDRLARAAAPRPPGTDNEEKKTP